MAHKKAGGSSKNGRDSESKRLGVKVFAGETVRCHGEVTAIRPAGDHDVLVVAQRIAVGGRIAAEGTAEVRLPR